MKDTTYVECCQRMVPISQAMPFHHKDNRCVYLCKIGHGCTQGAA